MKRIALTGLLVGLLTGTSAAQSDSVWEQDLMANRAETVQTGDGFGMSTSPNVRKPHLPKLGGVFRKIKDRRQHSATESGEFLQDMAPTEGDMMQVGADSTQEAVGSEANEADAVQPAELPGTGADQPEPWGNDAFADTSPHSRRLFRMPSLRIIPTGRFMTVGRLLHGSKGTNEPAGLGTGITLQDVIAADREEQPAAASPGELPLAQQSAGEIADLAVCDRCGKPWSACRCDGRGWTFFGEYLLLQPRGADPVFALRASNCNAPPIGTEQIDFNFESGFKVGLQKELADGFSAIAADFTHFEANDDERAHATVGTSVLVPVVAFNPGATCNASTSSIASADASINFDRVNLDYRRWCDYGDFRFDWLVGFAYGQLTQDLRARFDEDHVAVDTGAWGYGVHLGAGAEYGFGCLRGFGHADLTLLASNVKAEFTQTNAFVAGRVAHFDQDLDRIIPVLDLELGVAADVCHNTVVKAGYMYSIWFNVVNTPEFIDAVQGLSVDGDIHDTVTFDGLFLRLEYTW